MTYDGQKIRSLFRASFQARPKVWEKGRGKLTLCGPNGEMMNGPIMRERGVIYVDEGAGPRNQNQAFPCSTIPKSRRSIKEIPLG